MSKIEHLNQELADKKVALNSKIEEVRAGAEDDSTKVEDVQAGMDDVKQLKDEIKALSKQIETITEALNLEGEDLPDEAPKDAEKPQEEPVEPSADEEKRDDEIPDDSADAGDAEASDDEEINSAKDDKKEEQRSGIMEGINNMQAKIANTNDAEKVAFEDYLRHEEVRDGLTTVSGEAVVPTQILNAVSEQLAPNVLKQYVNRVNVGAPAGNLPIVAKASAGLVTKEELAKNPELGMEIKQVKYDVKTYAGSLPISQELLDDSVVNIDAIASQYISDASARTEQRLIIDVLKEATAKQEVTSVDDLKTAFNKLIPAGYTNKAFVLSQDLYNTIDLMKDADGRYLLQDSIASASGKALLGAPVYVVDDELMGAGAGFVGDLKSFVLDSVKKEVTVKWQDNDIWGRRLAIYLRADVQKAIDEAGVFLSASKA